LLFEYIVCDRTSVISNLHNGWYSHYIYFAEVEVQVLRGSWSLGAAGISAVVWRALPSIAISCLTAEVDKLQAQQQRGGRQRETNKRNPSDILWKKLHTHINSN
jgi:hypothetical protein